MKLLLDENLPHQMRLEIPGHEVFTVSYMGWCGMEDGQLLESAAKAGFDALITNDRGVEFEQNPSSLPLSVVLLVVKTNTLQALRPLYAGLAQALKSLSPCCFIKVE